MNEIRFVERDFTYFADENTCVMVTICYINEVVHIIGVVESRDANNRYRHKGFVVDLESNTLFTCDFYQDYVSTAELYKRVITEYQG